MKIKGDFITNSSSTAFFFIFKGKYKKNLFHAIKNHSELFNLTTDYDSYYQTTTNDILEGISIALRKNKYDDNFEKCVIKPINILLEKIKNDITIDEEEIKNQKSKTYDLTDLYTEDLNYKKDILQKIESAISKGFSNYLEIEFGDNHGHALGDNYTAMDYCRPELNSEDLILLNESRH